MSRAVFASSLCPCLGTLSATLRLISGFSFVLFAVPETFIYQIDDQY